MNVGRYSSKIPSYYVRLERKVKYDGKGFSKMFQYSILQTCALSESSYFVLTEGWKEEI